MNSDTTTAKRKLVISVIPELPRTEKELLLQCQHILNDIGVSCHFVSCTPSNCWPSTLDCLPPIPGRYRRGALKRLLASPRGILLLIKWVQRYCVHAAVPSRVAMRWFYGIKDTCEDFLSAGVTHFACWNRSCCAYGLLAELLELSSTTVSTIEWGCHPNTLMLTSRPQNIPGWNCKRAAAITPHCMGKVLNSATDFAPSNLYSKSPSKSLQMVESCQNYQLRPRILYLGLSEVDSFVIPNWHSDRKRFLPFSRNCLHLANLLAKINKDGVTVFKPHPSHNTYVDKRLGNGLHVVSGDPKCFIDWADIVITNGSKLEIDVLMHRKPLILVGSGFLWGTGVANEVSTVAQLREAISQVHVREESVNLESAMGDLLSELLVLDEVEHNLSVLKRALNLEC